MNSLACKFKTYFIIFIIFCVSSCFHAQTITTGSVSSTIIRRGSTITVSFISIGCFQEGRTFKLQLSNSSGNFSCSNSSYIGELEVQVTSSSNSVVSRTITGEIPSSIVTGNVYRVRVVYFSGGNTPSVVGTKNNQNIRIVASKLTPKFTLPTSICSGTALTLPTTSTNSITGTWSPALNNSSTTTYTFTPTAGLYANTITRTITVDQRLTPTFTLPTSICSGTTLTLPTTSTNSITGTWSPAFNDSVTTTYTFTPTEGLCANIVTQTITVNEKVTPIFTQVAAICSGGLFAIPTISENGISGTWSPELNFTETTTYTFTPSNGICATTSTMTVVVNPIITPLFNQVAAICSGGSFVLPTNSEDGISGSWSPELNFTETTNYTFTPTNGACATTSTMTVVVNPIITPTFNQVAAICEGTEFDLPIVSENGITGTWSPELNNLTTTTYTFIPTNGYCVNTNELIVVVNPKLTPSFDIISSICTGDSIFDFPQSSLNGIIGSWFPLLNNQETTEYTFTPTDDFCATQSSSTLVVNPIETIDTNVIAYQSYTWPANGQTYYSSGNYSFVSGCSERNLNLIINHTCILDSPGLISDIEEGLCLSGLTNPTFLIAPVSNATSYLWTVPSGVTILSGQGTTSVTLVISNNFSSGTLSVSASNECGSSPLRSIMLRSTIPSTPISISGITTGLCANGVNNPSYSIATVSGAISYLWTAPAGTTITSGQGTTSITLNITNNFTLGSLTVAALNECGSSALRSMILRSAIPTTPLGISGITSGLCANGVNNPSYSIAAVSGATSYIWTAPAGTTITSGQGTTSITLNITNSFTSGSLTVAALNECGSSALRSMILRSAIPTTPLGISGITTGLCSSGITTPSYSIAPVSGATSYVWSVPIGTTIISGQGTTSITLNITNSFTTGTLTVAASNECGLSQLRSMALTSSLSIPTSIIGSIIPCDTETYTCSTVANANSYIWTAPAGTTIISGQGTTSVVLDISNSFSIGSLSVAAVNDCGSSPLRSLTLRSAIPSTPLNISGITIGLCSNGVNNPTYSIAAVSGATSYTWSAPTGTTIISGQGTNSVVLDISASFSSGPLTVSAANECGSSPIRSITLRSAVPLIPASISGITAGLCENGINSPSYSIAAVADATNYLWTAPAGTTITSGQGTTSITLNITNTFISGALTVLASNDCGSSPIRSITLRSAVPTTPGAISGITTGLCSSGISTPTYSIVGIAGATNYVWTAPVGTTITSGQGTTSITLNISNGFTSGALTVAATNDCGSSSLRSMSLTSSLLTPTTITGSTTPCGTETYNCPSVINANSYIWTVPNGMEIISGQGTTSITVNVIGSSISGNVSVKASNNCKIGGTKTLAINSCSSNTKMESFVNQEYNGGIENKIEVFVFPNPTTDDVNVEFSNELKENVKIEVFNMIGQKIASEDVQTGISFVNLTLEGMPSGIYLLQTLKLDGTLIYTTKILKQ